MKARMWNEGIPTGYRHVFFEALVFLLTTPGVNLMLYKIVSHFGAWLDPPTVEAKVHVDMPSEEQSDDHVERLHALVDSYVANRLTINLTILQAGNDIATNL